MAQDIKDPKDDGKKDDRPEYIIDVRQLKNFKLSKTELDDGSKITTLEPAEGTDIKDVLDDLGVKPYKKPDVTPDDPPQGSVVNAYPPKNQGNEPIESKTFDSVQEMVLDLYNLRKTDPKVERALDKLWGRAVEELKAVESGEKKLNFQVYQCPDCGKPLTGRVCSCGWRSR